MNRAERIFQLHTKLKTRAHIPLSKLMQVTGKSRATINRDIEYMRDFMRAPIIYDRERNSYRYDPAAPEFELPGLWFNADELYALLATEQLLEGVQPGLLSPYIGPLKTRIRALLAQSGQEAEIVSSRIRLQPVAARTVDSEQFGVVAGAVLQGKVLELNYRGRERNQNTQRLVHPHRLVHYRNNWYLIAWCENAKELRTFSLDRITSTRTTEKRARAASDKELDRYLGASFGIFTGEAKAWAILRFNDSAARWVADEQWHPDQIGQWQGKTFELQVPYSDPRELIMDILKFGADVEVVGPTELRKLVAERLHQASQQYTR